jgi:hypothetical protein
VLCNDVQAMCMQSYGQRDEQMSQLELIHVNSSNLADYCERSEAIMDSGKRNDIYIIWSHGPTEILRNRDIHTPTQAEMRSGPRRPLHLYLHHAQQAGVRPRGAYAW